MSKTRFVARIWVAVGLVVVAIMLALVAPVKAITWGELDVDNVYSNVGTMVGNLPLAGHEWTCSGTLIAPTVYLTAGHCTAAMQAWIDGGVMTLDDVKISFSPVNVLDQSTWLDIAGFVTHPLWGTISEANNWHDVGLAILAEPVNLPLVNLPPSGFLDQLKDEGVLQVGVDRSDLLVVGYGDYLTWPPPVPVVNDGGRWYTYAGFHAITPPAIMLSTNYNLDYGGMCLGDSGGPTFVEYEGVLWQVGIHSSGNPTCLAKMLDQRVDIADTLDFIDPYLAP